MINKRNYGIDLLRLVLMYMVCLLHTLGQGGILANSSGGNFKLYWLLEIIAYCAVDGFAIISGYTAVNKSQKYEKIVSMWIQVFFYSFVVTLILGIFNVGGALSKEELVTGLLPVTFNKFWYFSAYVIAFLTMPLLNKYLFDIDVLKARKMFISCILLFCFVNLFEEPFKTGSGYSAIWIIVCYCVGFLAKKGEIFKNKSCFSLLGLLCCSVIFTWVTKVFFYQEELIRYISPTIVLNALILVVLFSRMNLKGTLIAKLSPLAFGIYLFQLNQIVWNCLIEDAFVFVVDKPAILGCLYVFAGALLIFMSGLVVEYIRSRLAVICRIPELSKLIVRFMDNGLRNLSVLLK